METFREIMYSIWPVLKAVLILVAAFVVAGMARKLVVKLLGKEKAAKVLRKLDPEGKGNVGTFIAKAVYLLVFLLFVPGIFSALGLSVISAPITAIVGEIFGYVPNVIAAIIVLVVGFMIAKLVRQILIPVFEKINVNKIQEKAGIEVSYSDKLSVTLAYIVYVLILIPMIILALDVLSIDVISEPAKFMLQNIFNFIPSILVGLVIIIIGCVIGKFIGQIVTRLIATAGLDTKVSKLLDKDDQKFSLSKVVGTIVNVVVVIFFVVEGLNVLNLEVLTNIGAAIIGYMPVALSAIIILVAAFFASSVAEKALKNAGYNTYAIIAKVAIFTVAGFMVLSQLGIAAEIVNTAFKLILAAVAIAVALAFGLGGKEFAAKTLEKLDDLKADEEKTEE